QFVTKTSGAFLHERSEPWVKIREGFHSPTERVRNSRHAANKLMGWIALRAIHGPDPAGACGGANCSRQFVTKTPGAFLHERSEPWVKTREGFHSPTVAGSETPRSGDGGDCTRHIHVPRPAGCCAVPNGYPAVC